MFWTTTRSWCGVISEWRDCGSSQHACSFWSASSFRDADKDSLEGPLTGGGPRIFDEVLMRLADAGFRGEGEARGNAADDRAVGPFAREGVGVGEADVERLDGGAVRDMEDDGEDDDRPAFMLPSCLTMSLPSHSPTYALLSLLSTTSTDNDFLAPHCRSSPCLSAPLRIPVIDGSSRCPRIAWPTVLGKDSSPVFLPHPLRHSRKPSGYPPWRFR